MNECEGKTCAPHSGEVRYVRVTDRRGDWAEFWLCERAIANNVLRGCYIEYVTADQGTDAP